MAAPRTGPLGVLKAIGDLLGVTSAGDVERLAVGTDGQVLTADSGEALGLKWADAAGASVFGDWYSNVDKVIGIGPTTLTLDTQRVGNAAFVLGTPTANEVTVQTGGDGTYRVDYDASLKMNGLNADTSIWLELNGVEVDGTRCKVTDDTNTGSTAGHGQAILALVAGDDLRLRGSSDNASTEAALDTVRLMIMSIGANGPQGPVGPPGSGSTIIIEEDGTPIAGTPHSEISAEYGLVASNAGGGQADLDVSLSSSQATATADTTTGSLTDTALAGMTLTPGAGTYLVMFSSSAKHSNGTEQIFFSLYNNGVQVAHTERNITSESSIPNTFIPVALQSIETVAAGQALDIRWRTTAATATASERTLTLVRIA